MLLVFGAPCKLPSLAGQEHGRTIPLTDLVGLAGSGVDCEKLAYPLTYPSQFDITRGCDLEHRRRDASLQ